MEECGGDSQLALSPETLEFVENAIQVPTCYDEELNEQQFDQLPADTHGILQLLMTQLGQAGTSNSIDQASLPPVDGTQWPENQIAAGFQPLTQQQLGQRAEISTADSRSTRTIGESEISERERNRRDRKREFDRAYRKRERERKQKLLDDNQAKDQRVKALDAEIERLKQELLEEQQLMKSMQLKQTKLEAEKEHLVGENLSLNERLEDKSREMDRLLGKMEYMEQQNCLFQTNLKKQIIKKSKKKQKKQVKMAETAEETQNDLHSTHDKNDNCMSSLPDLVGLSLP